MNDLKRWLAFNNQYLSDALAWLRDRLDAVGQDGEIEELENTDTAAPAPSRLLLLPKPVAMSDAEAAGEPPALVLLARRFGLSEFERLTLLLCAAMELDTRIGSLCARAQQDASKPFPTFALSLALFDEPAWEVVSPERPLRHWRLVEPTQTGVLPLVASALRADERIVNYLKGLNHLDDRLAPLLMRAGPGTTQLPPSQVAVVEAIVVHLEHLSDGAQLPVLQLLGADSQSKLLISEQAVERLGLSLYRLSPDAIPSSSSEQETFLRLWQRERALLSLALYIDARDIERGAPQAAVVRRLLARGMGIVFLDTREPWADVGRDSISVDVAKPTSSEQEMAWTTALGPRGAASAARMAAQFNFDLSTIESIAAGVLSRSNDDWEGLARTLWAECLGRARPALDQLAQPLAPKATWDELELLPAEKTLLQKIADQVRARQVVYDSWGFRKRMNRGLGISVLFAGESGTGKTMAAEVIANELGLLLYRIDLSAVVSKYIGETEKNLRRLFDAADDGGSILFFDEADALFGKRSEVKDSHDRYANIEINYLLQRIESYRGLAILATNMKAALDGAFTRRLRFIVNFAFPGLAERTAIWRKAFPPETPLKGLEFQRLARFNLTGGSIHNIAVNAAFLAAQARSPVSMPLVLDAARCELRKLDKPINEADFRWLETVGTGT
jgi:hypothetical protein